MARTRLVVFLSVATLAVACTNQAEPTTTTTESTDPVAAGRVVVLDDGGDIVTMNPDGSDRVEITEDGSGVRYFQPIWSPVGATIAFGRSTGSGSSIGFVNNDAGNARQVELAQFPFYFYWSPDGKRLGLLHNGTSGIDFEIVDVEGQFSSVVDSGSPYYFSWAPDGAAVVVHADGNRLAIFDESANPTDIGTPSAEFLSPRWTPAGIFYLGDGEVLLRTADDDERAIAAAEGFTNINPNREGSLVAIHTLGGSGGITVGLSSQQELPTDSVIIVDTDTGDSTVAADVFALASFWSPDGEKLLMLTLDSPAGLVGLTVWEDGVSSAVGSIVISPQLAGEALQYSDQYAQSWQVWSPGSDSFVLPGAIGDKAGIWVIPMTGEPSRISDGVWAAWSHSE